MTWSVGAARSLRVPEELVVPRRRDAPESAHRREARVPIIPLRALLRDRVLHHRDVARVHRPRVAAPALDRVPPHPPDVVQGQITLTAFHGAHVVGVQVSLLSQHFQRHLPLDPELPQPAAECSLHPVALLHEACFERLRLVDEHPDHAG